MSSVAENLARVRDRMAAAAQRAGRPPEPIVLVAVSKTFPAERIREAYAAGQRHFGENRVQEWEGKFPALQDLPDSIWHLVGHLQSNKARRALGFFHAIDSVDGLSLAQKLDRAFSEYQRPAKTPAAQARAAVTGDAGIPLAARGGKPNPQLPILLEVRLAPEETKYGVEPAALPHVVEGILALKYVRLRGLMCVPPLEKPDVVRPYFRRLRELRDELSPRFGTPLPELSMGMSHDFEVAIEEGATQVRVGSAIFGTRK